MTPRYVPLSTIAATAILLIITCAAFPALAQTLTERLKSESVEKLASDARTRGNPVRGAILFTQQNLHCTRCHNSQDAKPVGPALNALGKDVTDVHLVEALLFPSKSVRKGFESVVIVTTAGNVIAGRVVDDGPERDIVQRSTGDLDRITIPRSEIEEFRPSMVSAMPENLVDPLGDRQPFLDLIRYLMELAATGTDLPQTEFATGGESLRPELLGIVGLKEFNCQACHQDDISDTPLTAKQAPDLARSVGRINPRFLQQFIADPLKLRPGTTMPDVMVGMSPVERTTAAEEITHYLLSLGDERYTTPTIDADAADRGRETFHTVGCVACHSPRANDHRELMSESSVPLGKLQEKYSMEGLVAFLENPLKTRPAGRMPQMQLSHWEAVDIASYLLATPASASPTEPFTLNPDLAAKGKARFTQLGCQQCHSIDSQHAAPTSLALSQVRSGKGCLSGEQGAWPRFQLSDRQRADIQAALTRPSRELSNGDHIAITLTGLRCVNCHQRDRLGGVSSERDIYFHTANPNLGPQGRIPPTLTGVGAKLNPNWMRQVLVSGRTIRPYVTTRMPQYGANNVAHLVDLFEQADHLPKVNNPRFDDQKKLREVGTELIGTGGLNCIVCHTFQLKEAANMPAVDLTEMAERLKKDWFYHYMRDPQSLSRNTIMPSFWPAGRAMRKDVLDGDSDLQIEALWQYLLDGRQARTPRGLIVEPIELLATDEAVMLRRSYPGVGKRGIGVGFPQQVNLVFDAEHLRLAMIWKGKFADPGGVWRSQGHGMVRPLGDQLMRFSAGPDLDDAANPWLVDDGRPPSHQFMGYSLDDKMRPRFRYRFAGVVVEDYAVDRFDPSKGQSFLRRTVTFKSDADRTGLTFRAASGNSIVRADDGLFVVDERLHIQVRDASPAKIVGRQINGETTQQLHIPLHLISGQTTLTLDYRW